MKSVLVILFSVCLVNLAHADSFDGIWQGTGSVQAPDGSGHNNCTAAAFAIEQTANTLIIKKGEFQCGAINSSWTPVGFIIQGSDLVVNGTNQIYGHIDGSSFSFHFESGQTVWDANFELNNGTLIFHDQINYSSAEALVTDATFTKSDSTLHSSVTKSVQPSPTLEAVLQANNGAQQRFGVGNNTPGLECVIYATPSDSNYQFILSGGVISSNHADWYVPYGGSYGNFDIQYWSIDPQNHSLVFVYGTNGDRVSFNYDPETLLITTYTSNFSHEGLGTDTCIF